MADAGVTTLAISSGDGTIQAIQTMLAEERIFPVLQRHLGEIRPAITMWEAKLSDPRMKIEIEVTARKG